MPEVLIRRAEQHGIKIEVIPFIEVVPLDNALLSERIGQLACEKITAIFTSAHSVLSVKNMLQQTPDWQIACLDGRTRTEAVAYFGAQAILCAAPDAATLAQQLEAAVPARDDLVFFCGNRRLDYLPQTMKAAGKDIEEIVVYETHDRQVQLVAIFDGVLFFSPSAVDSFFSVNDLPSQTQLFAIGTTTAQSLKQYTTNELIISPAHTDEAMIDQVITYFTYEE